MILDAPGISRDHARDTGWLAMHGFAARLSDAQIAGLTICTATPGATTPRRLTPIVEDLREALRSSPAG